MRTAALIVAHLLLSAIALMLSGGVVFPGAGTSFAPGRALRGAAGAMLFVLQLPLGPLVRAVGGPGGLLVAAAVGNAVVWAVAARAVWTRRRRGA
jgi:hypothetical protein